MVDEANVPHLRQPSSNGIIISKECSAPCTADLEDDVCRIDGKLDVMLAVFSDPSSTSGLVQGDSQSDSTCIETLDTSKPPIIVTKCCRAILGCQSCVDQAGDDGLSKSCPNCTADRKLVSSISANELMDSAIT